MKVLLLVAVFLGCNILASSGSRIVFNATSETIDPLTTKNLTLRCALTDSPASSGKDKRSVPVHPMSDRQHAVMKRSSSDAVKHVKSTPNKVLSVSSIVISRNNEDLAKQVIHRDAVRRGSDTRYTVKGKMIRDGENFVELVWEHPTGKDAGEFKCEIATISAEGRSLVFSDNVTVEDSAVNNKKLIEHVNNLQAELQELKSQPKVFFSAALSGTVDITDIGHFVLKFDRVYANEGKAYDASTGTFTASVDGFYRFNVHVVSYDKDTVGVNLNKNGVPLFHVYSFGKSGRPSASASGIFKILKGEKVTVTNAISWASRYSAGFFNGQLVALA